MNRLRNPHSGVVVSVDDDTAKRLTAQGWTPVDAKKSADTPSPRKPRK